MSEFHSTADSLQGRLEGAERDVSQWENVDDIILENLHEHITVCKVTSFILTLNRLLIRDL